jgi:hypothetical protein
MLDAETMWDMSLFLFKKLIKLLDFHNFKFFPKASPMLGFSFSLLCRGGAIRDGRTGNRGK